MAVSVQEPDVATSVVDTLPDGVVVADADGIVTTVNSMAVRLLGDGDFGITPALDDRPIDVGERRAAESSGVRPERIDGGCIETQRSRRDGSSVSPSASATSTSAASQ